MKALAFALLAPFPALAETAQITDRTTFEAIVSDYSLNHRLLPITLEVSPDGSIRGDALGWAVTGSWTWDGSYFCREMDWSGKEIPYSCQVVQLDGNVLRFTDVSNSETVVFRLN